MGPLLTQVLSLGSFPGSNMAVSGSRKLAAVVRTDTPITAVYTLIPVVDVLAFSVSCNCKKAPPYALIFREAHA